MDSAQQDVVELVEYAARRLTDRMAGLQDDEWAWQPVVGDPDISIRWRLDHVVETLTDGRNREWSGLPPSLQPAPVSASSASEALSALDVAIRIFLATARELGDGAASPIGDVAGPYGSATRRSLLLHVADELIHHGAEAALLRDLHPAARTEV